MLLLFVCVFCGGWGGLDQSPTSNLLPFAEDGRTGYLDVRTGEWAIRPQFKAAQNFSEGLAAVQVGASWGYIDEKGAVAIKPAFLSASPFHEGVALVGNDQREWIYINKVGKAIASTEWQDGQRPLFSNGRGLILAKGKWGYIDANGRIVIDPIYAQAKPFSEGVAPVGTGMGWQLIDLSGKVRKVGERGAWGFSDARTGPFSEGLSVAMSSQPYGDLGYVDTNGVTAIEAKFMEAGRFAEGLAEVRAVEHVANGVRAGPVGYIDRSGQYVIPPRFSGGHEFSEGLAAVALDGKWGYIDKSAAIAISPKFAEAGAFSRGLALVYVDDQPKSTNIYEQARREPKLACIDKKGTFVWGPKAAQDRRGMSERILDQMVTGAVAGLRRGDQTAKDKVEEEMKKLPSTAVPLLKEYESTAEPELQNRIQRVREYLSGESKATEERLMSVIQNWGGSEYDVRPYTNGGYEVVVNRQSVADLSSLKGLPVKSLTIVSTGVRDLSPLAGMPLEKLAVNGSCDLTSVRGLPLKELIIESGTNDLKSLTGLKLRKLVLSRCMVTNLAPLTGMPLNELVLHLVPVVDLAPLEGMPLTNLDCGRASDLTFVKGMPLESISFDERRVTNGLAELRKLPDLKRINGKPAEQFWKRRDILRDLETRMRAVGITYKYIEVDDAGLCFVQLETNTATDLSALKGAPIMALSLAGTAVDDLTPLGSMPLGAVALPSKRITKGIETIRKMPGIKEINGRPAQRFWIAYDSVANEAEWRRMLDIRHVKYAEFRVTEEGKVILNLNGKMASDLSGLAGVPVNVLFMQLARVTDLSPLKGMPLTEFWAEDSLVSNLSPLEGMQITSLNLRGSQVKDLSPLKGMPLRLLYLMDTEVENLSALSGMPLYELNISKTKVRDLSPLKGLPLGQLAMSRAPVEDLSPLKGMKIPLLYINGTKIADLSPIKDIAVQQLGFTPENISNGMNDLRNLQSLKTVVLSRQGGGTLDLPASDFWKRYDAGEFHQTGY